MKVLFFSRTYTSHDHRFLTAIAAAGLECSFLCLEHDSGVHESRPLPPGVAAVSWQHVDSRPGEFDYLRAQLPAFSAMLETERPDVVHAGPVQSCAYLAALSGFSPLVVMSWGSDMLVDAARNSEWRAVTEFTLDHADAFICDCHAVRAAAAPMLHCSADMLLQFPWGIDLKHFSPAASPSLLRKELGWDDAIVFVCTRNWEPIYGIDILLEAFRIAHRSEPCLRLLLVGNGSQASMVKDFITRNRFQDAIVCPGVVPQRDMPRYFQAADVYVSCTYSDGTSISLLEAMATALPVIVPDTGGNREWVRIRENGWIPPPGDAEAFAAAILDAAKPEKRLAMGARNRKVAERNADWGSNVGQMVELYGRLCPAPLAAHPRSAR
jgi:glycosyltransferase involved in cell wall biosynthesis